MEPLHVVNQVAPREYVNFTLCFPFEDHKEQEAVNHLQRCVDDCIQQNPHLAGTIREQNTPQHNTLAYAPPKREPQREAGAVIVEKLRPSGFWTGHGNGTKSSFTYDELRAGGFSPGLFFDRVFVPVGDPAAVDGGGVPVMRVHAIFVSGGLLLGVFIHHAMADGAVATALIDDLAARSRGETALPRGGLLPKSQYLPLGRPSAEFEQRVRFLRETSRLGNEEIMAEMLPEWTTKDPNRGARFSIENCLPANPSPRVGKIFHFSKAKLARLSRALAQEGPRGGGSTKPPSTNVALMALIWAYVAKARMRAVGVEDWSALLAKGRKKMNDDSSSEGGRENKGMTAQLTIETLDALENFCGNAAKCPIAALPTTRLLWQGAAEATAKANSIGTTASTTTTNTARNEMGTPRGEEEDGERLEALAEIAALITRTLDSLDAEFVRRRAALLETLPDITAVAMNHDFEAPQNVLFNSHRFLAGADTVWDIPGLLLADNGGGRGTRRKPESIRKGRTVWGQGTVLVMPSSRESDVLEVMLAMSGTAMDGLCGDGGWRGWVERVVD
ncbi:hypothetical protein PG985_014465 [Apiospora marii]|uniref:uncharacterized protein n=1 Tax=Apiospora marii TaxID=335849 RepID=UPI00312EAF1B